MIARAVADPAQYIRDMKKNIAREEERARFNAAESERRILYYVNEIAEASKLLPSMLAPGDEST